MGEKQDTLVKYLKCEKPIIFVDDRELGCNVISVLKALGTEIRNLRLEVGDYLISDKVVVERKSASDFLNSIVDGRLFDQLRNMVSYEKPILIIEGSLKELFSTRNINQRAILGAIISANIDFGVTVLFSESETQTAEILYIIAKRLQTPKEKSIALNKKRKLTLSEYQQFIVESLPLVGPKTAKELLKKFGSVRAVFCAKKEELENIKNIGSKKAKKIIEILDAKYN
ncbi:MAG: ERCC4 domain-containing protein [Candidatus Diapherotrites archaeon]